MTTGLLRQKTTANSSLFVNPKLEKTEIHGYKLKETDILDKKRQRSIAPSELCRQAPIHRNKLHSAAVLFVLNNFKSSQ
ncbi:hypothetical protein HID58_096385 [Brassica napus]|uniref:Uncharacterized protein n=1 Tax=Brassica napus TaxID=3708 RepID=A0ABQ7X2C6_BRANA|nr:hypothetical protein HID58_096385 [Brassica napus]